MIQHYVPRWYLKRWTLDDESDDVCVFDADGLPRLVPFGLAGARRDWYTSLLPNGGRDDAIELELLQKVDDGGAVTTRALLEHGKLGPRQLERFCQLVGWLVVRGPQMELRAARVAEELNAARARGELGEEVGLLGRTAMTREGKRIAVPEGPFEFTHEDNLEMLRRARVPEAIAKMIERRSRWFRVRHLAEPLLQTCDAPVLHDDEFAASPEVAIATFLPLSPNAVLVIGDESEPAPDVLTLNDHEFALAINSLVLGNTIEQRYCKPPLLGSR